MSIDKSTETVPCNDSVAHVWLIKDSIRYLFVRPAIVDDEGGTPLSQLGDKEHLFAPGAIYMREEDIDEKTLLNGLQQQIVLMRQNASLLQKLRPGYGHHLELFGAADITQTWIDGLNSEVNS